MLLAAIAGYFLLQLAIALYAARRTRTETDYLVAGRQLAMPVAAFSLFATWFGAETLMGSSGAVAEEGLAGSRTDPFGYALCLVLMALLLAYRMRAAGFVTLGDFFKSRFSQTVERLAVLILVPTSVIWSAAQLTALSQVLAIAGGIDVGAAMIVATIVIIVYTLFGGLIGDVVTDVVQGVVIIIGLAILLGFVFAASGGLLEGLGRIEAAQLSFVAEGESLFTRIDAWAVPILGSMVAQESLSRVFATRSAGDARRAAFLASGIYLVIGIIPVLIALVGTHLGLELKHADEFLPSIAEALLPTALFVVLMGALVSAILSTVDSTILGIGALVSHNLVLPLRPSLSDREKLWLTRAIVCFAGLATYAVALSGEGIYSLVELSSSLGTAGIFVSVVIGLWSRWGGPLSAGAALSAGIATNVATSFFITLEAPFVTSILVAAAAYAITASTIERRAVQSAGTG